MFGNDVKADLSYDAQVKIKEIVEQAIEDKFKKTIVKKIRRKIIRNLIIKGVVVGGVIVVAKNYDKIEGYIRNRFWI